MQVAMGIFTAIRHASASTGSSWGHVIANMLEAEQLGWSQRSSTYAAWAISNYLGSSTEVIMVILLLSQYVPHTSGPPVPTFLLISSEFLFCEQEAYFVPRPW